MNISSEALTKIAGALHLVQCKDKAYPKTIELTAEEPFLYRERGKRINNLMLSLRQTGFEVKATTNGSLLLPYAHKIKESVSKIRVSLHSMDMKAYTEITGRNTLDRVKAGILAAKEAGIKITLNRLLLRKYLNDFQDYMNFVVNNSLTLKLLQLHYTSHEFSSFAEEDLLLGHVVATYIKPRLGSIPYYTDSNPLSPRTIYPLENGARIEVRLPISSALDSFPYCQNCELRDKCMRSNCLLPTSIKLSPDLRLFFCSIKNSPAIDLMKVDIAKMTVEELARHVMKEMSNIGFQSDKGFYLPIRAIVTSKCNFSCYFCHAEGFKGKEESNG